MTRRARTAWVFLASIAALATPMRALAQTPLAAAAAIEGTVSTPAPAVRLAGAAVVLQDPRGGQVSDAVSDGEGRFRIAGLADGRYRLVVSLDGFQTADAPVTVSAGRVTRVDVELPVAAVAERIEVVAQILPGIQETFGIADTIGSKENEQFTSGGGFQAALRLLASVIHVPGGFSIKGGRPSQAAMQLGAGTLVDPTTGLVALTLPPDAIDSVEVLSNPYTVEFGRFSSGLVVLRTRRGTDTWHVRLNNLDPGFRTKRHNDFKIVGVGVFAPRLEAGGPLIKDRLFLQQTGQYRYQATEIPSRPQNELRKDQWLSTFTRLDGNLSARHSLVATGGLFPSRADYATLGTFVPPDATVDLYDRVAHAAITERAMWTDAVFSESTMRVQHHRTIVEPLGSSAMTLLPETTLGNFFNHQTRRTTTYQWVTAVSATREGPGGLHLVKAGLDLLHSRYRGTSASRPVIVAVSSGAPVRRLDFHNPSVQRVESTDVALFGQDRLSLSRRWYVEFGGRLDRDGILDRVNVTPRAGTAVLLNESGTPVLRGGYGLFYERTPSAAGAFDQFEDWRDTRFDPAGEPRSAEFVHAKAPGLHTARSATWNLAYDHRLNGSWAFHAGLLDRRGSHELMVDPIQTGSSGVLLLRSEGRSKYRETEVGVDFAHSPVADLHATYVRSVARGDLNSFTPFFGALLTPVIGVNAYGPLAGDVPHRLLVRGRVSPTPRWLLLGVADWRTGFPYSRVNEALDFVGARHGDRFPNAFRLELGVERRFKIGRFEPWIGVRANNALNNFLPADVQANIASPAFGSFYNSELRQIRLVVRFSQ